MLYFILSILLIILTYIYVRWMQLTQYWEKRKVPYIPPNPLVGSLTFLQNENIALWLRRIYKQFKVPYVGIWVFWRKGLIVNSPEIGKNILIKDQANFRNRLISSGNTDPIGRFNLLTINDPKWTVIRKRLSVFFTSSKLRPVHLLITKKSKELVERIEKERQKPNPINIRSLTTDFSTDIIGTASFGLDSDATLTGKSHLRKVTEDFMKFDLFRGLGWCCIFFIPELVDVFRFKLFPKESTEYLREVLRIIIAQRGGIEKKVDEPRDLLDILIKIKQEDDEELDMTENMMLAQAAVFLQAGYDTTSNILTFGIYELAFSRDVQAKLFAELQEAKDKFNDNLSDAELSQLPYFNAVINVVLRKYPPFSWLDRVALDDYKVDDHLTIKAGTCILINVIGMHFDPDFYPEPNKFNPDRFLPDDEVNNKSYTYYPFGEGPRKCIGQRFGLSSVRQGLAAIVLNYEIRPVPNTPEPENIKIETKSLAISPENMLTVEFVPRK